MDARNTTTGHPTDEWVEIVEPKSKKKIYANLDSGLCAKHAPIHAIVRKSSDFGDLWWELYDKKTGKYYYYNSEQQKTAWTKPKESPVLNGNGNSNNKKLLIIPVSKLQTFKKISGEDNTKEKCDASTQTDIPNSVSIATQTSQEDVELEDLELDDKLKIVDDSPKIRKIKPVTVKSKKNIHNLEYCPESDRTNLKTIHSNESDEQGKQQKSNRSSQDPKDSSKLRATRTSPHGEKQEYGSDQVDRSVFGPSITRRDPLVTSTPMPVIDSKPREKIHHRSNTTDSGSTSTFGQHLLRPVKKPTKSEGDNEPQQMTTNNLSQYLVREARSIGIALISDDEFEDEQDSDDDCIADDEEYADLRSDLNVSQDFGEDSSEGWKSFSDQESPNGTNTKPKLGHKASNNQNSPRISEKNSSFTFNDLIDDQKDPASCMSQQLDHRKLVENFKKSRQTSSFGLHDSLGRAYKIEANNAVQKIKNAADNYFSHDKDQSSDRHLRQLSTLSTLPRPHKETKDKVALTKPELNPDADADYDVVEENCGYYSDSDQKQPKVESELSSRYLTNTSKISANDSHTPGGHFDRSKSSRGSTFSVESFARENLTRHPKKGGLLFNRKVKWSRMITWTKNPIKQPMISSVSSDLNADSIMSFKLIQQYMGDRKIHITKNYRQILVESGLGEEQFAKLKVLGRSSSVSASNTATTTNISGSGATLTGLNGKDTNSSSGHPSPCVPDRLRDELAYELAAKGCTKSSLRDEIYVQLARQLTENPSQESISRGLVLMSILLNYFSPSSKFAPFLSSFLETHPHQMARDVCLPRLDKRLRQNWLSYCRRPADGNEISIVRLSITKWPQYCGVFGESLERIMELQRCSPYLRTLRLPWILTTLGDKLIETGALETEGIFRCAADHDLIAQLRLEIDCVDFRKIADAKQVHSLLANVQDPHVIAGLLKLFFRQLHEPIFPSNIYDICLRSGHDAQLSCRIFNERLPNLNKDVVAYLINLLQMLARPDKVANTKMDNSNLSMVWAPNLLRMPENSDPIGQNDSVGGSKWSIANAPTCQANITDDHQSNSIVTPSQSMIFEQTRQEMQFIRSLIVHLDTSFIGDLI